MPKLGVIPAPKCVPILIPGANENATLHDKGDFAEVIKLGIFEMERLPWIIWVGPKSNHKGI